MKWLSKIIFALILCTARISLAAPAVSQDVPPVLELSATSDFQWTSVAVSGDGRVFASYPRGANAPSFHIAEIKDGEAVPLSKIESEANFSNIASIFSGATGNLWVLDTARLFAINLESEEIARVYDIPGDVMLPESRVGRFRVDEARGIAYITDPGHGGIIALDLASGDAWRALSDIPEVRASMTGIYFPHTGLFTNLSHSDGIELSADKKTLYFTVLGGDSLYSIPTSTLLKRELSSEAKRKSIKVHTVQGVPSDGMVLHGNDLYMGDLSDEGIWAFDLSETNNIQEAGGILNFGVDIRWASDFALAPDASIYFTTSAVNYPSDEQRPYELFHITFPDRRSHLGE